MKHSRANRLAGTGTLALMSPVQRLATGAGTNPYGGCVSPDGNHLYVALYASGQIGMYSRDASGALTAFSPFTVNAAYNPACVVCSPDGKHVYATSAGGDAVRIYSRNASTGLLTLLTPVNTGVTPIGIAITQDGAYVYVTNKQVNGQGSISQYSRNLTTGALTPLAPATVAVGVSNSQPLGIIMYGTSVYVGCFVGALFYAFTQDPATGQLTSATIPSYTAGDKPAWLAVSPDGKHLYTANDAATVSAGVSQFSRDLTTGELTNLGPTVTGGNGPFSIVCTSDGLNVYVGSSDGQTIVQHSRDPATGLLTPKTTDRVRSDPAVVTVSGSAGPQSITLSPDGRCLYAFNSSGNGAVTQFHVRP